MSFRRTERPGEKPGDIDPATGARFTDFPTFLELFLVFILLVVIGGFAFEAIKTTIQHFWKFDDSNYQVWIMLTLLFVIGFIILERFVLHKPFRAFY
jgi:hypothetical protein